MSILSHLFGCAVSASAGGLFGLIGNLATKSFHYLETKQSFAAKQAEWQHETELLKLQWQWKQPETEREPPPLPIALAGSWSGLLSSLDDERGLSGSYKWVDAARALVRPLLTLGLSGVLAAVFFSMAPDDLARDYVVDSLVFAAVTSIVWWFGDRAPQRNRAR
jgi:hypothetical protein